VETTEDFNQLRLRFIDPVQHDYELVRPIVLFAQPIAARSRETETERTTVGDTAQAATTKTAVIARNMISTSVTTTPLSNYFS
jgi:hypothetical protein